MKEINGYLLVEVPMTTNISKLRIGQPDLLDVYGDEFGANTIQLPKGNYSIIGLAKDLTQAQWNEIREVFFKDHSLNPNTTLILKQVV